MHITDFDYDLPPELIAQYPEEKRDEARLLVIDRKTDEVYHKKFFDIVDTVERCVSGYERFQSSAGQTVRRKERYGREGGVSFDPQKGRKLLGDDGKAR